MKNKKIGVCACYNTKNYGSMLQTLATGVQLERLGYEYEFIRYSRKLTLGLLLKSLSRIPEKLKEKKQRQVRLDGYNKYPGLKEKVVSRNKCFDDFMNKTFVKISPVCDTYSQVKNQASVYDAVLVGSDQLWRPEGYSTGFYNLMFVPEYVHKIAYATSFGVSNIPNNKKGIAKKFLNRIEDISVRELRASEIIEELTGRKVPTVVDPTLLFTGDEWKEIIPQKNVVPEGEKYVFCYLLGTNIAHRKAAEELREATGCKIVTIPHLDEFVEGDISFGDMQLFDVGPAEFVNLIRNAEYVCTDSFHGTVFSILNHKQFVTFSRFSDDSKQSRNSRIESLFEQTGLNDRHCTTNILETMNRYIDYVSVEEKLTEMRRKSVEYLSNALK
ncbi:MAG: polysaccharide pyruvyl transferase family protein [Clostridia bacterium]|nr:polysaccharide pyruvyl transferase family protein [Clostridia bacterium]